MPARKTSDAGGFAAFLESVPTVEEATATVQLTGAALRSGTEGSFVLATDDGAVHELEVDAVRSHTVPDPEGAPTRVTIEVPRDRLPKALQDGIATKPLFKEGVKDPIFDPGGNTGIKDPILDPGGNTGIKDPPKDPIVDPPKHLWKDPGKDPVFDPPGGNTGIKDPIKDPIVDPPKRPWKEAFTDPIFDPPGGNTGIKDPIKDPIVEGGGNTGIKDPILDPPGGGTGIADSLVEQPGGFDPRVVVDPAAVPFVMAIPHQAPPAAVAAQTAGLGLGAAPLAAKSVLQDAVHKLPIHDIHTLKELTKDPIQDTTLKELIKDPIQDASFKEPVWDPPGSGIADTLVEGFPGGGVGGSLAEGPLGGVFGMPGLQL